ncbi:uncharacterized protein E0L32_003097 [Thyridium curvatum]|uniref:Uncharacterized protein n=1 Tax=Thyridium curvatum TaxID=1093900 RepID=A0A507BFB5_9PEZI|nr:uncharacterized protein E0L32_003097 [Thyridium curvatum]TPX17454.1 hypothetical protein E0L32_003097 [Thyridium curvatum]
MSAYEYDAPPTRERSQRYYREERRGDRYGNDNYLRVQSRDLVPRAREDSDLSVEEIHRDFPPPGYQREIRRARSAEPGYYDEYDDRRSYYAPRDRDYDRDYDREYDRRSHKKAGSVYYEEEEKKKRRMLSQQQKILAAVAGAALIVGGKELYDRREAKQEGGEVHRNAMASAALGAAGALAAYKGADFYNSHAAKDEKKSTYVVHKGRDGKVTEYYSDEDEDPKEKKGHKNFLENALAAAGLGGAMKALTGGKDDDKKSDTRSRRGSRSRSSSRTRGGDDKKPGNKIQQAAMASLIAGATEAFRVSRQPGGWKGEKAKRVLTAAAGAATIDAAQNPEKSNKLSMAESVIGGLLGNRVINGSKKNIEEDKATGRSRSRSRAASRSDGGGGGGGATGLAALATAGLGAFGAKKIMENRERSKSRGRGSPDGYDSRDGSPDRRHRSRSRSVVDTARRSLARLGIGNGPEDDRDRDYDSPRGASRKDRHRRDPSADSYDDGYSRDRGYGRDRRDDYDDDRSYRRDRDRSQNRSRRGGRGGGYSSASESDLGDSSEDEKRAKKMRGKQIITTGLATVATIHAAHNVYQSMEKRNQRHKAVREGRLSPEEAKKLKSKAILQDAASISIAALGIKGAISELKEARERTHEVKQFQEEKAKRHERRLQRLQRANEGYSRSRADNWEPAAPPRSSRFDDGPRYVDGNPYSAALPAPPVGYSRR